METQKKEIQDILKKTISIIKETIPELDEIPDINKFYDPQVLENETFF